MSKTEKTALTDLGFSNSVSKILSAQPSGHKHVEVKDASHYVGMKKDNSFLSSTQKTLASSVHHVQADLSRSHKMLDAALLKFSMNPSSPEAYAAADEAIDAYKLAARSAYGRATIDSGLPGSKRNELSARPGFKTRGIIKAAEQDFQNTSKIAASLQAKKGNGPTPAA